MKIKFVSSIVISLNFFLSSSSVLASDLENDFQGFYKFCNKFPANTFCVENSPISLKKRQGYEFYCWLAPNNFNKSTKCKVSVEDKQLVVYLEKTDKLKPLDNSKDTEEIRITIEDAFLFNSQWWVADAAGTEKSVGMFTDIQVGYIHKSNSNKQNISNFLIISTSDKQDNKDSIYSNEKIPVILEQLEPWLYHLPDLSNFKSQLQFDNEQDVGNVSQNVSRLLETKECPYCDLRNADLSNTDLKGANLEGANLQDANLEKANLERAYLLGANLQGANLQNVNLEKSILVFGFLKNANLSKANLRIANLQNADLENANLSETKLNSKGLNVTQLQNTNLNSVNLSNADIKCANLHAANLKNANLTKADFKKCEPSEELSKKFLSNFQLNGVNLSTPVKDVLDVVNAALNFALIGLGGGELEQVSNIVGSIAMPRDVKFISETNLSNANLSSADLTETNLEGANLSDANLSNAKFGSTELKKANLNNTNLINTDISNVNFEEANLCNAIMPDLSVSEQGCFEDIDDVEESKEGIENES